MKSILVILQFIFFFNFVFALNHVRKELKIEQLLRKPPIITPTNGVNDTVYEGWVRQRLDNFDPQNTEHFYMRYLLNMNYLVEGGPIFIVSLVFNFLI
jgi:hypothetical protein